MFLYINKYINNIKSKLKDIQTSAFQSRLPLLFFFSCNSRTNTQLSLSLSFSLTVAKVAVKTGGKKLEKIIPNDYKNINLSFPPAACKGAGRKMIT